MKKYLGFDRWQRVRRDVIDDADNRRIDRDERRIERQRRLARVDEINQLAEPGADRVDGNQVVADLALRVIEGLDQEQLAPGKTFILLRSDDGSDDATQVHRRRR